MTPSLHIDPQTQYARLQGQWILARHSDLQRIPVPRQTVQQLDATGLEALDTAGAATLAALFGTDELTRLCTEAKNLAEERKALLLAVARSLAVQDASNTNPSPRWDDGLARLGRRVQTGYQGLVQFLGFLGLSLLTLVQTLPRPGRWRLTALVAQMQQAGLNAVPIVLLLNFLVGAVVAFLGATVLADFGATIYTVDLVAYAFMRELGVLLAAILLAGRTASAYAAQIGSMKLNEELDALAVQGLDIMELLVLPRLLALVIMLPLLTFLAILAGMAGGALVAAISLDISTLRFLDIVQDIPSRHLWLGLAKAPVFALVIALIGCLEGLKVRGSAESLGEHTTSAVVQSIFAVILLDAIAALFFMEMHW